jgi:hypothetical protein
MNRFTTELHRLYLPAGTAAEQPRPAEWPVIAPDGQVRCAVLELFRPANWAAVSRLWQGVQADLDLPAPAIAVNGKDGYQLWFSWTQPMQLAQALAFMEALRARYLPEVATQRLRLLPQPGQTIAAIPSQRADNGQWSAFVAPDLAAVFEDEPALDRSPGEDAQADALTRLRSIRPDEWLPALGQLQPAQAQPDVAATPHPAPETATAGPGAGLSPQAFLLQVMNDPGVTLALRIEAAKALLKA